MQEIADDDDVEAGGRRWFGFHVAQLGVDLRAIVTAPARQLVEGHLADVPAGAVQAPLREKTGIGTQAAGKIEGFAASR